MLGRGPATGWVRDRLGIMRTWSFAKGHGTGNDFVILLDRHGMTDPSPETVQFLCDRHRGIGGDGLLRVVPSRLVDGPGADESAHWFMDYRNADGSIAEMCGNGVRVFAHYLVREGLDDGAPFVVGPRAGARRVRMTRTCLQRTPAPRRAEPPPACTPASRPGCRRAE